VWNEIHRSKRIRISEWNLNWDFVKKYTLKKVRRLQGTIGLIWEKYKNLQHKEHWRAIK